MPKTPHSRPMQAFGSSAIGTPSDPVVVFEAVDVVLDDVSVVEVDDDVDVASVDVDPVSAVDVDVDPDVVSAAEEPANVSADVPVDPVPVVDVDESTMI